MGKLNTDPYQGMFFKVKIEWPAGGSRGGGTAASGAGNRGGSDLHFAKVSGLSAETEAAEYRTGQDPPVKRMLAGLTTYGDVTLEDGLDSDNIVRSWRESIVRTNYGGNAVEKYVDSAFAANYKGTVTVTLLNKAGEEIYWWKIIRAWPSAVEYGDVDASSDVIIRSVTLKNEGILEKAKDEPRSVSF
jgi:phage tail-like protein